MSENMQDAFERELAKLFPGHALDELDAGLISVSKAMFFSAAEKYGPLCKSQMKATEVEPDAFAVIDHNGEIGYSVSARTETPAESLDWGRDMCHQHINDCAGSGVEGAGQWVVRPVYIGRHPAPAAVPSETILKAVDKKIRAADRTHHPMARGTLIMEALEILDGYAAPAPAEPDSKGDAGK